MGLCGDLCFVRVSNMISNYELYIMKSYLHILARNVNAGISPY
jgi:hypothetical protein